MSTTVIIAAAGQGKRMRCDMNKVFLPLAEVPVLCHTIAAVEQCTAVDHVVVVTGRDDVPRVQNLVADYRFNKVRQVVIGGSERQDSVYHALCALDPVPDIVVIQDGARPFVDARMIDDCLQALEQADGAVVAVPVKDTVKQAGPDHYVEHTPDRQQLWLAQTPQAFRYATLKHAYQQAQADRRSGTDDASLVEQDGGRVQLVMGSYTNIKLTTRDDLLLAEQQMGRKVTYMIRTGIGYDVHAFVSGRPLVLGGIIVPYEQGLLGHSDADVLIHAVMDALLGAAGLGDIGRHFPDSDPDYKGISSVKLLQRVAVLLREQKCEPQNIDVVVVAQQPKLAPYIEAMTATLARTLALDPQLVNIKATTTEGLGFTGRREGIAAYATTTVRCLR